jgi:DNA-binding GntR family transcriptional regulator
MGVKSGTPSLALVRRYRGSDGRVFLVTIAEHPAERYTYSFRLRRSRDGAVWLPD